MVFNLVCATCPTVVLPESIHPCVLWKYLQMLHLGFIDCALKKYSRHASFYTCRKIIIISCWCHTWRNSPSPSVFAYSLQVLANIAQEINSEECQRSPLPEVVVRSGIWGWPWTTCVCCRVSKQSCQHIGKLLIDVTDTTTVLSAIVKIARQSQPLVSPSFCQAALKGVWCTTTQWAMLNSKLHHKGGIKELKKIDEFPTP